MTLFAATAHADDRSLLSAAPQPPNIMWTIDSSGSMYNWICRDFAVASGSQSCMTGSDMKLTTLGAAKQCLSNYFENVRKAPTDLTFVIGVDELKYDPILYPPSGVDDATNVVKTITRPYPRPDQEFVQNGGDGPQALFPPDRVFGLVYNDEWTEEATSIGNYCNSADFPNCAQRHRCIWMLRNKGYFFESGCSGTGDPGPDLLIAPLDICVSPTSNTNRKNYSTPAVMGNFIRYEPPKYVTARRVMKEIMMDNTLVSQRMGLEVYNGSTGGNLVWPLGPSCTTAADDANAFKTNKSYIRAFINNISFDSSTPLGETADDVGCYYANGKGPTVGILQSGTTPSFTSPNTRNCKLQCVNMMRTTNKWPAIESCSSAKTMPLGAAQSPAYAIPSVPNPLPADPAYPSFPARYLPTAAPSPWPETFCNSCQKSFSVLITDGVPNGDDVTGDFSGSTEGDDNTILRGVSYFMRNTDLNTELAGTQNVTTFTVSFGVLDASGQNCLGVLAEAASQGGGQCYPARNAAELKEALSTVLVQVSQSSKSFAAPAIQATRTQAENATDLAVFKTDDDGPLWRGHLYAFRLWDEAVQGELSSVAGNSAATKSVYVVDANNSPLKFDSTNGNLLSKPVWDAQLCLSGDFNQNRTNNDVDPFNLDVSQCKRYSDEGDVKARKIYTKVTVTAGSGAVAADGFTVANASSLATPMAMAGQTNAVTKMIRFFRGSDTLDRMGQGDVSFSADALNISGAQWDRPADRNLSSMTGRSGWFKLGDIFHSAPTLVDWEFNFMPASWVTFYNANKTRSRAIIVGANDGMIHAFHAGKAMTGDNPATTAAEPSDNIYYDDGTGEELWAFVPNHQLPRMKQSIACANNTTVPCSVVAPQNYYVDGSPWVRDIWAGGSTLATVANLTDATKGSAWKTAMIVGDRDGGTQYTALDVTDTTTPKFMWEFPQPSQFGSGAGKRAEPAGASWSDVLPVDPPIVPILWDADGSATSTTDRYLRWVALLPGGFSRNHTAGRGFYIVDAYTGDIIYKFEKTASPPSGQTDLSAMLYSFAAPPTAVPSVVTVDGRQVSLTTEIVAVDTGGQVWRATLGSQGVQGDFKISRVFRTATYSSNPDANTTVTMAEYPYRPLFQTANASRDGAGDLWVFFGSGDRDFLTNPNISVTGVAGDTASPANGVFTSMSIDANIGSNYICGSTQTQRFYALNLDDMARKNAAGTSYPFLEAALQDRTTAPTTVTIDGDTATAQMSTAITTALTSTAGWYLRLLSQEKVDNPAAMLRDGRGGSLLVFSTYQPTANCSGSGGTCGIPAGMGRLYTFRSFNGLTALSNAGQAFNEKVSPPQTRRSIVDGQKSAAVISMKATPDANAGSQVDVAKTLIMPIYKIDVSRQQHEAFQRAGSQH